MILEAPRGSGGFGYDPLFYFPERGQTFAEAGIGPKRDLSHRARAMRAILPQLLDYLRTSAQVGLSRHRPKIPVLNFGADRVLWIEIPMREAPAAGTGTGVVAAVLDCFGPCPFSAVPVWEQIWPRRLSAKGDKDAKDLIRIATIADAMGTFRAHKISAYVRDDHLELLPVVHKSPVVVAMAGGNAVIAKKLRASFAKLQHGVDQAYRRQSYTTTPPPTWCTWCTASGQPSPTVRANPG